MTLRLTSASGGECVGTALQSVVGTTATGTINMTQSGTTLTASIITDPSLSACHYTGTASSGSFVLNLSRCDGGNVLQGFPCANGAQRDLEFATNAINATVTGTTATGTSVETYNVNAAGTNNRVGVLTINASFSATRR